MAEFETAEISKFTMARDEKAIKNGAAIDIIIKSTGLSKSQIEKLK